jgi:hypothetical protein
MRINPNRSGPGDYEDPNAKRASRNRTVSPDSEPRSVAAGHMPDEDVDGQLGPDELPDPEEVAMNLECKRHH